MQSHASRHVVSEFLQDLHPQYSTPFPKGVISDEVAEAIGRRAVPKLIAVLDLPDLPDDKRSHALRVFNDLLSTQEHKTNAIHEGAAGPLTRLVDGCRDIEVRRLSCRALASLAQVMAGRQAIAAVGGVTVLTQALQTTPEAAAQALRAFSMSNDGVALLNGACAEVMPALVELLQQPQDTEFTLQACENAVATIEGVTRTDVGVVAALAASVPRTLVALAQRGLEGDFRYEAMLMAFLELVALSFEQICHHAAGKVATREADAFKVLSEMLVLQHRGTVKHAAGALMGLAVDKESKVPVMLFCGVPLVRLMRGDDPELRSNARDAVAACAEHLEARRTAEMLLSHEEREMLLWRGSPPAAPPDYRFHVELPKFALAAQAK